MSASAEQRDRNAGRGNAHVLQCRRTFAATDAHDDRHHHGHDTGDGRDQRHRSRGETAVEHRDSGSAGEPGKGAVAKVRATGCSTDDRGDHEHPDKTDALGDDEHREQGRRPIGESAKEVATSPECSGGQRQSDAQAVVTDAAACSPSSSTDAWRIRYFCTLPVTVMGNESTSFQ